MVRVTIVSRPTVPGRQAQVGWRTGLVTGTNLTVDGMGSRSDSIAGVAIAAASRLNRDYRQLGVLLLGQVIPHHITWPSSISVGGGAWSEEWGHGLMLGRGNGEATAPAQQTPVDRNHTYRALRTYYVRAVRCSAANFVRYGEVRGAKRRRACTTLALPPPVNHSSFSTFLASSKLAQVCPAPLM